MKSAIYYLFVIGILSGCGSSGSSGGSGSGTAEMQLPVVTPSLIEIPLTGIPAELGNFDPAPSVDAGGGVWMSYS